MTVGGADDGKGEEGIQPGVSIRFFERGSGSSPLRCGSDEDADDDSEKTRLSKNRGKRGHPFEGDSHKKKEGRENFTSTCTSVTTSRWNE